MVTVGWDTSALKVLMNTDGDKVCEGCCDSFEYTFASGDCCCFLDPSPDAWDSGTTYDTGDMVSYSGSNYYSTIDNNLNNTPPAAGKWVLYISCGNETWNDTPPFGGVGKTPRYYALSVDYLYHYYLTANPTSSFDKYSFSDLYVLDNVSTCMWEIECQDTDHLHEDENGSTSDTQPFNARLNLRDTTDPIAAGFDEDCNFYSTAQDGLGWAEAYPTTDECDGLDGPFGNSVFFDECKTKGTSAIDCSLPFYTYTRNWQITMSWRPLDCDYSLYDTATNYSIDACVAYSGRFWRCCISNGPGTVHGVQNPTGTDTTCTGSNYWKVV